MVASGGEDCTIRFWDIAKRLLLEFTTMCKKILEAIHLRNKYKKNLSNELILYCIVGVV